MTLATATDVPLLFDLSLPTERTTVAFSWLNHLSPSNAAYNVTPFAGQGQTLLPENTMGVA
jgi:hypothetical protein